MIRGILILCCLCVLGVNARAAEAVDVNHMVDVLCMKETPKGWDGTPGPCGELGRPQLTEGVWNDRMAPRPFSQARDPVLARECAVRHVRWIIEQIRRRGLPVTPARVATVWHFGISHAGRRTQWGLEVAALYNDLL
jgi:hypothetical protein